MDLGLLLSGHIRGLVAGRVGAVAHLPTRAAGRPRVVGRHTGMRPYQHTAENVVDVDFHTILACSACWSTTKRPDMFVPCF